MSEELNVQGFGVKAKVSGADLKIFVLILIVAGVLAYFIWDHDRRDTEHLTAMLNSVQELTYVMTLTADERKELQLGMPDSLRKKVTNLR